MTSNRCMWIAALAGACAVLCGSAGCVEPVSSEAKQNAPGRAGRLRPRRGRHRRPPDRRLPRSARQEFPVGRGPLPAGPGRLPPAEPARRPGRPASRPGRNQAAGHPPRLAEGPGRHGLRGRRHGRGGQLLPPGPGRVRTQRPPRRRDRLPPGLRPASPGPLERGRRATRPRCPRVRRQRDRPPRRAAPAAAWPGPSRPAQYEKKAAADAEAARQRAAHLPATTRPVLVDGKLRFFVQAGWFDTRDKAAALLPAVRKVRPDAFIIPSR